MDLKVEEVRLMVRGSGEAQAREPLSRLKRLLIALAADTEEAVIAHTRFTGRGFQPTQLVSRSRTVRFVEELTAQQRDRTRTRALARPSAVLLVLTAIAYAFVNFNVWTRRHRQNYAACEFQRFACRTRPWQYRCDAPSGRISLRPRPCGEDTIPPFEWGTPLLSVSCDAALTPLSRWSALPLPLLLVSTVLLPLGLFWNNAHLITVRKVVLWTPTVPIILAQCLFRAAVLCSIVSSAFDTASACIQAAEAIILTLQVGTPPRL